MTPEMLEGLWRGQSSSKFPRRIKVRETLASPLLILLINSCALDELGFRLSVNLLALQLAPLNLRNPHHWWIRWGCSNHGRKAWRAVSLVIKVAKWEWWWRNIFRCDNIGCPPPLHHSALAQNHPLSCS